MTMIDHKAYVRRPGVMVKWSKIFDHDHDRGQMVNFDH